MTPALITIDLQRYYLEVFHERWERSPLVIARELRDRFEQSGARSIRQFCRGMGEDWSVTQFPRPQFPTPSRSRRRPS
jgi:hypothetical protein